MPHLDYAQRALEAFAGYAQNRRETVSLRIYNDGSGCAIDLDASRIWFEFTDLKDLFEALQSIEEEG